LTNTTPKLEDIRDAFGFFDSWEDKYRFVIDLGRQLPALDAAERTDDRLVPGCQSQVWLITRLDDGRLRLTMDSDAHIVRGLIAILLAAYQDRSPQEVVNFDIEGLFDELDLLSHLSPTRGNGLREMVSRIRQRAAEAA